MSFVTEFYQQRPAYSPLDHPASGSPLHLQIRCLMFAISVRSGTNVMFKTLPRQQKEIITLMDYLLQPTQQDAELAFPQ